MLPDDETTALLIRARGFIERGWCRGASAKDAGENSVEPISKKAVAWCMVGGLEAAGWNGNLYHPALTRLSAATDQQPCAFNNAQETVEPVLAAFDRAIAGQPK